jgi:hypothetical protein
MNLFNKLPGFERSPPGWEQIIWRRLPAIWLWGTLVPLGFAALNHLLSPTDAGSGAAAAALLFVGLSNDWRGRAALDAGADARPGLLHREGDEGTCLCG